MIKLLGSAHAPLFEVRLAGSSGNLGLLFDKESQPVSGNCLLRLAVVSPLKPSSLYTFRRASGRIGNSVVDTMPSASSKITKPVCHNPPAVHVDKVPRNDVDSGNAKLGKDIASST